MKVIEEIAAVLGISLEEAREVRDRMEEDDMVDWSEASQETVNEAIREAYAEVVYERETGRRFTTMRVIAL